MQSIYSPKKVIFFSCAQKCSQFSCVRNFYVRLECLCRYIQSYFSYFTKECILCESCISENPVYKNSGNISTTCKVVDYRSVSKKGAAKCGPVNDPRTYHKLVLCP